ncbi:hypothetical protein BDQ17DRAFT_6960 [Cyathus striatus]|nr:hypothetical protein BDQ17DRAFT_6960 [Cyathus striatus]
MADEFDDLPDDLADLQNVDWDNLLGAPDSHPDPPPIPGPSSPRPASSRSSHYQFDDEIDDSFLHELDQLEHRLTQNPVQPSGFQPVVFGIPSTTHALPARPPQSVPQTSRFFNGAVGPPTNLVNRPTTLPSNNHSSRSPLKRPRSPSEDECPYSFAKKGKRKASEDETHFLAAFEDEIICPMCVRCVRPK